MFNHINEQILKNARVVEDNERLETELPQRADNATPSTTAEDVASPLMGVPEEQHRELANKYDELSKKYQDLSQKVKYLERKNNAVMQKNRDMKESVRAWQQYADRRKPNQKPKGPTSVEEGPSGLSAILQNGEVSPRMPSSSRSVSTMRIPFAYNDQGCSSPAPGALPVYLEAGNEAASYEKEEQSPNASITPRGSKTTSSNGIHDAAYEDSVPNMRLNRAEQLQADTTGVPSSSQTTIDEGADQITRRVQAVDTEDEDDLPQIVSERSLKRKRDQTSRIDAYAGRSSDGTPAKPHRVKEEPLSSPPPAMHILARTETIDLDDPAPSHSEAARPLQRTPPTLPNTPGIFRHQRSTSVPLSQPVKRENAQGDHRTGSEISNVQARLRLAAAEARALSEPTNAHPYNQHVLQPLDPNTIARTPDGGPNKRKKQVEARHAKHDIPAESSKALLSTGEDELRNPSSAVRARFSQRTRASKNPQTPVNRLQRNPTLSSPLVKQEQLPTPSSTPRPGRAPSGPSGTRRSACNARLNQQEDITPDGRPVWSMRASEKRPSAQKSNTSPSGMQLRLRNKPVKELKVQDFRPNPAYNQGYSYAFSEAVRKRADRLCLPGCTNPQCCGSTFRRLAEALEPLPAEQEEALLEEYLGDAYSAVISTQMSSDERVELVLQARTKKMAKDAGKHREAYERRKTPPGFWRVDFPTTQEQEDDRVRTKLQESKTVQERWLEAHKKGGKWIFRDE